LIYSVNQHCGRSAFSGKLAAEWIDNGALVLLVMLRDFESIIDLQAVWIAKSAGHWSVANAPDTDWRTVNSAFR